MLSYLLLIKYSSSTDDSRTVRTCVCVLHRWYTPNWTRSRTICWPRVRLWWGGPVRSVTWPPERRPSQRNYTKWAPSNSDPTSFIRPLSHFFKTFCALFPLRPSASCLIHWTRLMPCWMRRRPEPSASPASVMLWDKRICSYMLKSLNCY